MEQLSTLSRVYGSDKAAVFDHYSDLFLHQETVLEQLSIEAPDLEKSPEEKEIISSANFYINELLEHLGLPGLTIPEENIHILPSKYDLLEDTGLVDGTANPQHQAIIMKRCNTNLESAKIIFHEIIHLQGYYALHNDDGFLKAHRRGLITYKNGLEHFRLLDEALTEELTREFILRYQGLPLFKEETDSIKLLVAESARKFNPHNRLPAELEKNGLLFSRVVSESTFSLAGFAYPTERDALNGLIDKLQYFNSDKFSTRKQVFNMFVGALFTGHLFELGKLIDNTFGKGAFRELGSLDNAEQLLAFVYSLQ